MLSNKKKSYCLFGAFFLIFVVLALVFLSFIAITLVVGYDSVGKFFYDYGSTMGVFIAAATALFAIRSQNENVRIQINADRDLEDKRRELEDATNALNILNSLFLTPQRILILNGSSDNIDEDINALMAKVIGGCTDLRTHCLSINKDLNGVVDGYLGALWGMLVVKSIDLSKSDMTLDGIVKHIIDAQRGVRDHEFIDDVAKGEISDLLALLPKKISSLSLELETALLQKRLEKQP